MMAYRMPKSGGSGGSGGNKNVCPNDRQLALRAKLRSGWSSATSRDPLKPEEQATIISVIRRNEEFENVEKRRVCRLIERVKKLREYAEDGGFHTCTSCTNPYRRLLVRTMKCNNCGKAICSRCGLNVPIRYFTVARMRDIWLCRLCSETREMWKKTGAWFYKSLPFDATAPKPTPPTLSLTTAAAEEQSFQSPITTPKRRRGSLSPQQQRVRKLTIHVSSSSGSEEDEKLSERPLKDSKKDIIEDQHFRSLSNNMEQLKLKTVTTSISRDLMESGDGATTNNGRHPRQCRLSDSSCTQGFDLLCRYIDTSNVNTPLLTNRANFKSDSEKKQQCNEAATANESGTGSWMQRRSSITSTDTISDTSSAISMNQLNSQGLTRDPLLGWLEVSIAYRGSCHSLDATMVRARDLRSMDTMGLTDPYCKLNIITAEGKPKFLRWQKTRTVHKTRNPEFNETLKFLGVEPEEVNNSFLYVVIYDEDKYGHDFLGASKIPLVSMDSTNQCRILVPLMGEDQMSSVADESQNWPFGKVLVALCYSTKKRMLLVTIKQCKNLLPMDNNGSSDPFIKLQMKPDSHRNKKFKTSIKWHTLDPVYNEEFQFEASPQDLNKQCLILTAWDKDLGKSNDFLGSLVIGYNSRGERLQQWLDCIRLPDQFHEKWHCLDGGNPLH